jgi:hypothetical protein
MYLSGWQASLLNGMGRTVLINNMMDSQLTYAMSALQLPKVSSTRLITGGGHSCGLVATLCAAPSVWWRGRTPVCPRNAAG